MLKYSLGMKRTSRELCENIDGSALLWLSTVVNRTFGFLFLQQFKDSKETLSPGDLTPEESHTYLEYLRVCVLSLFRESKLAS